MNTTPVPALFRPARDRAAPPGRGVARRRLDVLAARVARPAAGLAALLAFLADDPARDRL